MDTSEKPPEVQIPAPAQAATSGSQPERSSAVPLDLPPQDPPVGASPVGSEAIKKDKSSHTGMLWAVAIVVGVIILAAIFGSGSRSGSSTSSFSRGQSSGGGDDHTPAPAPAPVYVPPVSKALDEKNGFKDFRFGMTVDEAKGVLQPSNLLRNPGANAETLYYYGTSVNRIGEFVTGTVSLQFFEGRLFRVNLSLTSSSNEIFEALRINYGEPLDCTGWKRGTESLKAKCWQGEKIFAAIVGPTVGVWDAVVIYDQATNQKAREYADKEPERAAKDFSTNGFKSLTMGMRSQDITRPFIVRDDDKITKVKKIVLSGDDLLTIGFYLLTSVTCEFFDDRLYRIDLAFNENRKEIFQTVQQRFGQLQNNNSWTRGSDKVTAKSAGDDKFYTTILAPGGSYGGEEWDLIVMLDYSILRESEQFKQDTAKEAAKDFSTNGFKSLTMGMRLQEVAVPHTVSENSAVTGVKKIVISRGDLISIGFYPLRQVNCEFFNDRLYRVDLEFNQNRKEIFQTFQRRFDPLQKNDTWTQENARLTAKSGGSDRLYGTILAPGGAYGGEEWETIVLLDCVVQREAAQFKLDAPKRAAKDL